ncbi:MAG: collagen-like protein, partial [Devosia nanyangense]|nr:collagen-like protein [Devosia nanyangense]
MAVLSDYVTGTITLTNGSATFTGVDTGWLAAAFREGDAVIDVDGADGIVAIVASIETNTSGTLTREWTGPTLAGVAYRLRYQSDGSRVTAQTRQLLELLGSRAFFQFDASGTLAERDQYDAKPQGFTFLDTSTDPMGLYVKASDVVGDWSGPAAYATGAQGAQGEQGEKGDQGDTGPAGADGTDPGVLMTWSELMADADPGAGNIRANSADLSAATTLFVSKTNRAGDDMSAWLAHLADSTNPGRKGGITLTRSGGNAQATFDLTALVDAVGYVKLAVANPAGATGFFTDDAVSFQFAIAGDKGSDGAGTGDMLKANNLSDLTNKQSGFDNLSLKAANIASAATIDLDAATGSLVTITGTAATSAVTLSSGRRRRV